MPVGALIGSTVIGVGGSVLGSHSANKAANTAADAQVQAAQLGVDEQRAAREQLQKLLAPYVSAGGPALQAQLNLLGLGGQGSQQQAIDQLAGSDLFQTLASQGEDAILQNASATGNLRGGVTQEALARFRPQLLNQFLGDQWNRLGQITTLGQNSAAGVGSAGMNSANNIAQLFGDVGSAQAGAALAKGQNNANMFGNIAGILSGAGMFGMKQGLF